MVIGNFDGVHRGHVAVLQAAQAAEPNAPLVVVTFWPHPMSIVRPDQAPLLLTDLDRRTELLRRAGADRVEVVEFTPEVAGWSPAQFVDTVLRPLHPIRVVVGQNFRFGFRASGDVQTLAELGVSLQQIVVTEMRDHTYFAELHLRRAEGEITVLSSRPSDAIALAVRVSAPLFASEELLDAVGQDPTPEPEEEAEEILDEFRDFIEHVNPDDFA